MPFDARYPYERSKDSAHVAVLGMASPKLSL